MIDLETRKNLLNDFFNSIEDESVKKFMEQCIETIPEYWFVVPASSTGKYHPNYALGDGGLKRHTLAMLHILNVHLENSVYRNSYTDKEKDLLRVAVLMHDSRKSGSDEDYSVSKFTKFEHPLLAAEVIRSIKTSYITKEEREYIAKAIESHMGEWNTDKRSTVILPVPETKAQKIIHMCNYLASRKWLEDTSFKEEKEVIVEAKQPDIATGDNYIFDFGKYKGKTYKEIEKNDPGYLDYLVKSGIEREPIATILKNRK